MIKKLEPELRFPEFKNDGKWMKKKLGKMVGKIKSSGLKASNGNKTGLYPFFTCSEKHILRSDTYYKDLETIILSTGGKSVIHYYNGKFNSSNDVLLLVKKEKWIDLKFINYLLVKKERKLNNMFYGTGLKHLNKKELLNFDIYISPTKEEQEKIGTFFFNLDKKIEVIEKKLKLLKEYKNGLLQKLLTINSNGIPELRFLEFKNDGKWIKKQIGEIVKERKEKTIIENQHPILSSGKNGIEFRKEKFSRKVSKSNKNYKIVYYNDFVYRPISEGGTFNNKFYFNIQNIVNVGIVSSVYPVFYIIDKNNFSTYLYYYLNYSNNLKKLFVSEIQGTVRGELKFNKLRKIEIYIPPTKEEQEKIGTFFFNLDQKIKTIEKKLKLLKEYKNGLLQKLLI